MQLPQTSGLPKSIPQPLLTEVAHAVYTVRQQPKAWFAPDDTRVDDIITGLVIYHEDCQTLTAEEQTQPEFMSQKQFSSLLVWACELDDRIADGISESEFSETELQFLIASGLVRREDIRE